MYLSILDRKRLSPFRKLAFLEKYKFYLADGTALALHICHRTSLDFDFYTERSFEPRKVREDFDKIFKMVKEIHVADDTLGFEVDKVMLSFLNIRPHLSDH